MSSTSKHFINRDFIAPNVREIDVDMAVLAGLSDVSIRLQQRDPVEGMVDIGNGLQLCAVHPAWQSDVLWISQTDRAGYDYFENLFRRLRIADNVASHIAHDREIVMYSGFFVTRSYCSESNFHCDWIKADNDGFTYLGPLSDNCGELGIVYRNLRGQQGHYNYQFYALDCARSGEWFNCLAELYFWHRPNGKLAEVDPDCRIAEPVLPSARRPVHHARRAACRLLKSASES
jgi:hypothetical protein